LVLSCKVLGRPPRGVSHPDFFLNNHFSLKAHPTQTFTPAAQVQSICICFAAEVNPAICSSLWNDYYVQQQLHPVGFYENVCSAGF